MAVDKYNKYSAFFDSLNDPKAAFYLEKEEMYDTIEEIKNNSFKDKTTYSAKILSAPISGSLGNSTTATAESDSNKVFFVKVRLDEVEDQFLPDPNEIADPVLRKKIISQHKTAVFNASKEEEAKIFAPGDVVESNFAGSGPNDNGKLRGLNLTNKVIRREPGNFEYMLSGSAQNSFENTTNNPTTITQATYQPNSKYRPPEKKTYTGKAGTFQVENGVLKAGMIVKSTASLYGTEILIDCYDDFERLCKAFEEANITKGKKPNVSGFRSYQSQVIVREDPKKQFKKEDGSIGYLGAYPGTSNHGWGVAIDFDTTDKNNVKGFDSLVYKWLEQNAEKYNFFHPLWAQKPDGWPQVKKGPEGKKGSKPEPWHWEYKKKSTIYK